MEDVEAEKEYITVAKVNDGIMIRHKVRDEFENMDIYNEWMVRI
ncbi:hypothetical protein ACSXDM_14995 (plasmid) [Clostridium perfringens]